MLSSTNDEFYFEGDQYFNPELQIDDSKKKIQVEKLLNPYRVNKSKIEKLISLINHEIQLAFQEKPERSSNFPMINTFVTDFPNGTEVGDYIGIDIGGTNFRVVHLNLSKVGSNYKNKIEMEFFSVPANIRLGNCKQFFGFLASCIKSFVDKQNLKPNNGSSFIPLGFTFSFGFEQHAIDKGEVFQMGIATNVYDVMGKDPVELLQQEMDAIQLPVRVVALMNDATGTLIYGKYLDKNTFAGLILGSGTNIAYVEDVSRYRKISDPFKTFGKYVEKFVVNSEFPLFGDKGEMDSVKNKYDFQLDDASLTPHIYTYEKVTGGAFLGELLRFTLIDLVKNGLVLDGKLTDQLKTPASIQTASISAFEYEFGNNGFNARDNTETRKLLINLGYESNQITADDCSIVTFAGQLITNRSAIFIASAVAVFADHMNLPEVKFACDGSLFKKHPKMERLINSYLSVMCPNRKVVVFSADQGSGIGAAMLAAVVMDSSMK
ncbi:hypothetical protein RDWZM_001912 [Blomia tropicalis]|uniref:Phosphotransferase n=1 Tax=Blomia tropicalis TaxID=40697 RepID=A0A9Q0MFG3_BLOTA|nr:hypothetical protein RDWZM_001912 [Blomia tropicalis]